MAKWKKTPPELAGFLEEMVSPYPVQPRRMFGFPTWFVRGNMFLGAFGDGVFLRLAKEDRAELLVAEDEVRVFEPIAGRPMREYLLIPASLFADRAWFGGWIERSFRHAATLPPKAGKG
jgi:hypothetical protein